jgi:hypothetical protein
MNFDIKWLGLHFWRLFYTNSSGHPALEPRSTLAFYVGAIYVPAIMKPSGGLDPQPAWKPWHLLEGDEVISHYQKPFLCAIHCRNSHARVYKFKGELFSETLRPGLPDDIFSNQKSQSG